MVPLVLALIFIIICIYDLYIVKNKRVNYVNYYFETSIMENNIVIFKITLHEKLL
jgi:hypothetical protein